MNGEDRQPRIASAPHNFKLQMISKKLIAVIVVVCVVTTQIQFSWSEEHGQVEPVKKIGGIFNRLVPQPVRDSFNSQATSIEKKQSLQKNYNKTLVHLQGELAFLYYNAINGTSNPQALQNVHSVFEPIFQAITQLQTMLAPEDVSTINFATITTKLKELRLMCQMVLLQSTIVNVNFSLGAAVIQIAAPPQIQMPKVSEEFDKKESVTRHGSGVHVNQEKTIDGIDHRIFLGRIEDERLKAILKRVGNNVLLGKFYLKLYAAGVTFGSHKVEPLVVTFNEQGKPVVKLTDTSGTDRVNATFVLNNYNVKDAAVQVPANLEIPQNILQKLFENNILKKHPQDASRVYFPEAIKSDSKLQSELTRIRIDQSAMRNNIIKLYQMNRALDLQTNTFAAVVDPVPTKVTQTGNDCEYIYQTSVLTYDQFRRVPGVQIDHFGAYDAATGKRTLTTVTNYSQVVQLQKDYVTLQTRIGSRFWKDEEGHPSRPHEFRKGNEVSLEFANYDQCMNALVYNLMPSSNYASATRKPHLYKKQGNDWVKIPLDETKFQGTEKTQIQILVRNVLNGTLKDTDYQIWFEGATPGDRVKLQIPEKQGQPFLLLTPEGKIVYTLTDRTESETIAWKGLTQQTIGVYKKQGDVHTKLTVVLNEAHLQKLVQEKVTAKKTALGTRLTREQKREIQDSFITVQQVKDAFAQYGNQSNIVFAMGNPSDNVLLVPQKREVQASWDPANALAIPYGNVMTGSFASRKLDQIARNRVIARERGDGNQKALFPLKADRTNVDWETAYAQGKPFAYFTYRNSGSEYKIAYRVNLPVQGEQGAKQANVQLKRIMRENLVKRGDDFFVQGEKTLQRGDVIYKVRYFKSKPGIIDSDTGTVELEEVTNLSELELLSNKMQGTVICFAPEEVVGEGGVKTSVRKAKPYYYRDMASGEERNRDTLYLDTGAVALNLLTKDAAEDKDIWNNQKEIYARLQSDENIFALLVNNKYEEITLAKAKPENPQSAAAFTRSFSEVITARDFEDQKEIKVNGTTYRQYVFVEDKTTGKLIPYVGNKSLSELMAMKHAYYFYYIPSTEENRNKMNAYYTAYVTNPATATFDLEVAKIGIRVLFGKRAALGRQDLAVSSIKEQLVIQKLRTRTQGNKKAIAVLVYMPQDQVDKRYTIATDKVQGLQTYSGQTSDGVLFDERTILRWIAQGKVKERFYEEPEAGSGQVRGAEIREHYKIKTEYYDKHISFQVWLEFEDGTQVKMITSNQAIAAKIADSQIQLKNNEKLQESTDIIDTPRSKEAKILKQFTNDEIGALIQANPHLARLYALKEFSATDLMNLVNEDEVLKLQATGTTKQDIVSILQVMLGKGDLTEQKIREFFDNDLVIKAKWEQMVSANNYNALMQGKIKRQIILLSIKVKVTQYRTRKEVVTLVKDILEKTVLKPEDVLEYDTVSKRRFENLTEQVEGSSSAEVKEAVLAVVTSLMQKQEEIITEELKRSPVFQSMSSDPVRQKIIIKNMMVMARMANINPTGLPSSYAFSFEERTKPSEDQTRNNRVHPYDLSVLGITLLQLGTGSDGKDSTFLKWANVIAQYLMKTSYIKHRYMGGYIRSFDASSTETTDANAEWEVFLGPNVRLMRFFGEMAKTVGLDTELGQQYLLEAQRIAKFVLKLQNPESKGFRHGPNPFDPRFNPTLNHVGLNQSGDLQAGLIPMYDGRNNYNKAPGDVASDRYLVRQPLWYEMEGAEENLAVYSGLQFIANLMKAHDQLVAQRKARPIENIVQVEEVTQAYEQQQQWLAKYAWNKESGSFNWGNVDLDRALTTEEVVYCRRINVLESNYVQRDGKWYYSNATKERIRQSSTFKQTGPQTNNAPVDAQTLILLELSSAGLEQLNTAVGFNPESYKRNIPSAIAQSGYVPQNIAEYTAMNVWENYHVQVEFHGKVKQDGSKYDLLDFYGNDHRQRMRGSDTPVGFTEQTSIYVLGLKKLVKQYTKQDGSIVEGKEKFVTWCNAKIQSLESSLVDIAQQFSSVPYASDPGVETGVGFQVPGDSASVIGNSYVINAIAGKDVFAGTTVSALATVLENAPQRRRDNPSLTKVYGTGEEGMRRIRRGGDDKEVKDIVIYNNGSLYFDTYKYEVSSPYNPTRQYTEGEMKRDPPQPVSVRGLIKKQPKPITKHHWSYRYFLSFAMFFVDVVVGLATRFYEGVAWIYINARDTLGLRYVPDVEQERPQAPSEQAGEEKKEEKQEGDLESVSSDWVKPNYPRMYLRSVDNDHAPKFERIIGIRTININGEVKEEVVEHDSADTLRVGTVGVDIKVVKTKDSQGNDVYLLDPTARGDELDLSGANFKRQQLRTTFMNYLSHVMQKQRARRIQELTNYDIIFSSVVAPIRIASAFAPGSIPEYVLPVMRVAYDIFVVRNLLGKELVDLPARLQIPPEALNDPQAYEVFLQGKIAELEQMRSTDQKIGLFLDIITNVAAAFRRPKSEILAGFMKVQLVTIDNKFNVTAAANIATGYQHTKYTYLMDTQINMKAMYDLITGRNTSLSALDCIDGSLSMGGMAGLINYFTENFWTGQVLRFAGSGVNIKSVLNAITGKPMFRGAPPLDHWKAWSLYLFGFPVLIFKQKAEADQLVDALANSWAFTIHEHTGDIKKIYRTEQEYRDSLVVQKLISRNPHFIGPDGLPLEGPVFRNRLDNTIVIMGHKFFQQQFKDEVRTMALLGRIHAIQSGKQPGTIVKPQSMLPVLSLSSLYTTSLASPGSTQFADFVANGVIGRSGLPSPLTGLGQQLPISALKPSTEGIMLSIVTLMQSNDPTHRKIAQEMMKKVTGGRFQANKQYNLGEGDYDQGSFYSNLETPFAQRVTPDQGSGTNTALDARMGLLMLRYFHETCDREELEKYRPSQDADLNAEYQEYYQKFVRKGNFHDFLATRKGYSGILFGILRSDRLARYRESGDQSVYQTLGHLAGHLKNLQVIGELNDVFNGAVKDRDSRNADKTASVINNLWAYSYFMAMHELSGEGNDGKWAQAAQNIVWWLARNMYDPATGTFAKGIRANGTIDRTFDYKTQLLAYTLLGPEVLDNVKHLYVNHRVYEKENGVIKLDADGNKISTVLTVRMHLTKAGQRVKLFGDNASVSLSDKIFDQSQSKTAQFTHPVTGETVSVSTYYDKQNATPEVISLQILASTRAAEYYRKTKTQEKMQAALTRYTQLKGSLDKFHVSGQNGSAYIASAQHPNMVSANGLWATFALTGYDPTRIGGGEWNQKLAGFGFEQQRLGTNPVNRAIYYLERYEKEEDPQKKAHLLVKLQQEADKIAEEARIFTVKRGETTQEVIAIPDNTQKTRYRTHTQVKALYVLTKVNEVTSNKYLVQSRGLLRFLKLMYKEDVFTRASDPEARFEVAGFREGLLIAPSTTSGIYDMSFLNEQLDRNATQAAVTWLADQLWNFQAQSSGVSESASAAVKQKMVNSYDVAAREDRQSHLALVNPVVLEPTDQIGAVQQTIITDLRGKSEWKNSLFVFTKFDTEWKREFEQHNIKVSGEVYGVEIVAKLLRHLQKKKFDLGELHKQRKALFVNNRLVEGKQNELMQIDLKIYNLEKGWVVHQHDRIRNIYWISIPATEILPNASPRERIKLEVHATASKEYVEKQIEKYEGRQAIADRLFDAKLGFGGMVVMNEDKSVVRIDVFDNGQAIQTKIDEAIEEMAQKLTRENGEHIVINRMEARRLLKRNDWTWKKNGKIYQLIFGAKGKYGSESQIAAASVTTNRQQLETRYSLDNNNPVDKELMAKITTSAAGNNRATQAYQNYIAQGGVIVLNPDGSLNRVSPGTQAGSDYEYFYNKLKADPVLSQQAQENDYRWATTDKNGNACVVILRFSEARVNERAQQKQLNESNIIQHAVGMQAIREQGGVIVYDPATMQPLKIIPGQTNYAKAMVFYGQRSTEEQRRIAQTGWLFKISDVSRFDATLSGEGYVKVFHSPQHTVDNLLVNGYAQSSSYDGIAKIEKTLKKEGYLAADQTAKDLPMFSENKIREIRTRAQQRYQANTQYQNLLYEGGALVENTAAARGSNPVDIKLGEKQYFSDVDAMLKEYGDTPQLLKNMQRNGGTYQAGNNLITPVPGYLQAKTQYGRGFAHYERVRKYHVQTQKVYEVITQKRQYGNKSMSILEAVEAAKGQPEYSLAHMQLLKYRQFLQQIRIERHLESPERTTIYYSSLIAEPNGEAGKGIYPLLKKEEVVMGCIEIREDYLKKWKTHYNWLTSKRIYERHGVLIEVPEKTVALDDPSKIYITYKVEYLKADGTTVIGVDADGIPTEKPDKVQVTAYNLKDETVRKEIRTFEGRVDQVFRGRITAYDNGDPYASDKITIVWVDSYKHTYADQSATPTADSQIFVGRDQRAVETQINVCTDGVTPDVTKSKGREQVIQYSDLPQVVKEDLPSGFEKPEHLEHVVITRKEYGLHVWFSIKDGINNELYTWEAVRTAANSTTYEVISKSQKQYNFSKSYQFPFEVKLSAPGTSFASFYTAKQVLVQGQNERKKIKLVDILNGYGVNQGITGIVLDEVVTYLNIKGINMNTLFYEVKIKQENKKEYSVYYLADGTNPNALLETRIVVEKTAPSEEKPINKEITVKRWSESLGAGDFNAASVRTYSQGTIYKRISSVQNQTIRTVEQIIADLRTVKLSGNKRVLKNVPNELNKVLPKVVIKEQFKSYVYRAKFNAIGQDARNSLIQKIGSLGSLQAARNYTSELSEKLVANSSLSQETVKAELDAMVVGVWKVKINVVEVDELLRKRQQREPHWANAKKSKLYFLVSDTWTRQIMKSVQLDNEFNIWVSYDFELNSNKFGNAYPVAEMRQDTEISEDVVE